MKGSMEMKMQAIDEMLEMRKQMIVMQDNLGIYNGFGKGDKILIYSTEDFFEMARRVKERVSTGNIASNGMISIMFSYNGVLFNTFIWPREYQLHENEIDRGETDA